MIELQTKGFEILSQQTKDNFDELWQEYSKKIERKLKGAESCRVHIKEYNSEGSRAKFSINILCTYAGKSIEANSTAWVLGQAFKDAFNKIEEQAEHKFHISDQNKK